MRGRVTRVPLVVGDLVTSYLRPDDQFVVVDFDRRAGMVQCRSDSGLFWCARSVLRRVE